jgi:quercetin dioxygenase-like cupin family protein
MRVALQYQYLITVLNLFINHSIFANMKRRHFMLSSLAAAPLIAAGQTHIEPKPNGKPFVIKMGEARFGTHTPYRGVNPNDLKISKKDTGGMAAMFEYIGTEKIGPPMHIHFKQDEIFYVAEGTYLFQVGNDKHTLKAGDSIFLPRQVQHTWLQLSDTGKLIYWVTPAGKMEDFFLKMNGLTKPPTPQEAEKIHREHDMTIVGPPLSL